MTTEVLVMNKNGVALAADSAVTVTRMGKQKIYDTANKLFTLSKYCPVGIMIYGNSEVNGVPWESIIKIYRDNSKHKFFTLREYADDFISFLNGNDNPIYDVLFPDSQQEMSFASIVYREFLEISEKINKAIKDKDAPNITETDGDIIKEEITKGFIKDYHEKSKEGENLITVPENYGPEIVTKYEKILEKCKDDAFKGLPVSKGAGFKKAQHPGFHLSNPQKQKSLYSFI